MVAQWDSDSSIEFVKPTEIVWQEYEGEMIKFKHMLVTPNHRMVLEETKTKQYKVRTAEECSRFTSQLNYPIKGTLDGVDEYSYEFYELLVAVQADGHFNTDSNAITFNFVKKRKTERLLSLLNSLEAEYSSKEIERNGKVQSIIRLLAKDPITLLLKTFFTVDKKLLINFMDLSLETKVKLIRSMGHWDGTYSKTGNAITIESTDFDFVNNLQALSHTSGFKCALTTFTGKTAYGVCTVRRAYINLKDTSRGSLLNCSEHVQYKGYIGCVSVPTGFILVRREDQVFVSGNTINAEKLEISRTDAKSISYACVPEDTEVWSTFSGWIPISKIKPGVHQCVSVNTKELINHHHTEIEALHTFKDKEVFELTTDTDDIIKCTGDHRWFVLDHDDLKYKYVETLEYFEGDYSIVKSIKGIKKLISYYKFKEIKSIGIQQTYCITTETSNFYMRQGNFQTLTGNCLYGASPGKLCKMLSLSPEDGEKLYEDYWDALPALKELRDRVEAYWEGTGKSYILGIDGRRLMARSKHSLLNLLFQSGGSVAVKYSLVIAAQKLEEMGLMGDVFSDTQEEAREKVYQMIMYHK